MQALPRKIDSDAGLVAKHINVDSDRRCVALDTRALTASLTKLIDHGVFDFERAELCVRDRRVGAEEIHRQGVAHIHMLRPVDRAHAVVQGLRRWRCEITKRQQHAVGQARPETDPIGIGERTVEINARAHGFGVFQTQTMQFCFEQRFKTVGDSDEEGVSFRQGRFRRKKANA